MNNKLIGNIVRFIILVLLQVGLFKNIGYYNLVTLFPYILFLFLLPIRMNNIILYAIAFATGLTIDAFYNSIGVHAAACTALAWFRIFFYSITLDIDDLESTTTPSWGNMGFKWFITYISFGTLIHHLVLFFVEVFSLENALDTLLSVFLSSAFTIVLLLIMAIITYKRKSSLVH